MSRAVSGALRPESCGWWLARNYYRVAFLAITVAAATSALLLSQCDLATAQTDKSKAALTVVASDKGTVHLQQGSEGKQFGTLQFLVVNAGDVSTSLRYAAFLGNATRGRRCGGGLVLDPSVGSIGAHSAQAESVTVSLKAGCAGSAASIVVSGDAGVNPATGDFSLSRDLPPSWIWWPIIGGLAVLMGTLGALALGLAKRLTLSEFQKWLREGALLGPAWSFKDSWLTNVAAAGAVLTTVLGTSGFLDQVLPGTPTGQFVGLSLVGGAAVTMAPLVYLAWSKWDVSSDKTSALESRGSIRGLLLATGVTLFGVYLELGTLGLLVNAADGTVAAKAGCYLLLIGATFVVARYAVRSTLGTVMKTEASGVVAEVRSAGVAL
jgi:hypothetical protein